MSVRQNKDEGLLYDMERDGVLEIGDVIYIYEDGSRELVKGKK